MLTATGSGIFWLWVNGAATFAVPLIAFVVATDRRTDGFLAMAQGSYLAFWTALGIAIGYGTDLAARYLTSIRLEQLPDRKRRWRLTTGISHVGSAPSAQVRLQSAGMEPLHAVIDLREDAVWIRGLQGTVGVNGASTMEANLTDGDVLTFGSTQLEVVSSRVR